MYERGRGFTARVRAAHDLDHEMSFFITSANTGDAKYQTKFEGIFPNLPDSPRIVTPTLCINRKAPELISLEALS